MASIKPTTPDHVHTKARLTLDYPEDLAFFEALFRELHREKPVFGIAEIVALLRRKPELVEINSKVDEEYWRQRPPIGTTGVLRRRKDIFNWGYKMKIGVIGGGSMGKRRVRDLQALGCELTVFDARPDRLAEVKKLFNVSTVDTFDALLGFGPEALVISVPPDQHLQYYELSFSAKLPFFSEMNVFTPEASWFSRKEAEAGVRSYPSGTWQFYPLFRILKEQLAAVGTDKINTVHYECGGCSLSGIHGNTIANFTRGAVASPVLRGKWSRLN